MAGSKQALSSVESVRSYIDALYQSGLASRSIARHITTLRNFHSFLVERGAEQSDPTSLLSTPKQWQSLPKYLNGEEIARLIAAPDKSKPAGLRDHAMLEFLYATGLRVSELCKVRVSEVEMSLGYVRVLGKGNKHRLVPVGVAALKAVEEFIRSWPSRAAAAPLQPLPLRDSPGQRHDAPGFLEAAARLRTKSRHLSRSYAACSAAHFCDPSAGGRRRSQKRPNNAGPCGYFDHPDIYARHARPSAQDHR